MDGEPLGRRVRVYDDTFAPSMTLIANGTYKSNATDWFGKNVTGSRVTLRNKTAALRASNHITYDPNLVSPPRSRGHL